MNKETATDMASRAAGYLVAMEGQSLSESDLSFAMEIFSGVPKENCLDMILEAQAEIRKLQKLVGEII